VGVEFLFQVNYNRRPHGCLRRNDLRASSEYKDIFMERFEKVATIGNEIEAMCLKGELEDRGIPHGMQSYHDSAYDGLFQFTFGWGHVEAPRERRDEILEILDAIRRQSTEQNSEADKQGDIG
jgi:hypothetical protein